eukprot:6858628-Prymnesium_polylepis.1
MPGSTPSELRKAKVRDGPCRMRWPMPPCPVRAPHAMRTNAHPVAGARDETRHSRSCCARIHCVAKCAS